MLYAVIFCWLVVTDAPVRLDAPAFAERRAAQKSARHRPLYSLGVHLTTTSVEEAAATESNKYLKDYHRLRLIAKYAVGLDALHNERLKELAPYSYELRYLMVVLIESRYDWQGEKMATDWEEVRNNFLGDGSMSWRGWDCYLHGISPEWEWTCDQYSLMRRGKR